MEQFQGFPLVEKTWQLAGRSVRMASVADVEALFNRLLEKPDDHVDIRDERIPYWAEVWPSAIGLSEYILHHPELVAGKRILEIGCGLGLPGIVAGMQGGRVILSDYLEDPLVLARYNWGLNLPDTVEVLQLDWRQPEHWPLADLVLASDVAYESRSFPYLRRLIEHYREQGSTILISEPNRMFALEFFSSLSSLQGYTRRSYQINRDHLPVQVNVHVSLPAGT